MPELPRGTVTFLFTDIEGSTRLLRELGPGYADALAEHRRLLRETFQARGGVEVDTQGDAFFYAFGTAPEAVEAAAAGQAALSGGPVRVRMGVHTGEPELTGEGYVGLDVHLGARIAAVGHGGQVLLSRATHGLVEASVLDLGEHRLKDFGEPVWIFQLGSESFPPLKTISNTNLPRPASTFVGREREQGEVVSLLRDGARLLTLTGPGGSGKTRLGIEAAAELVSDFKNGVFWIGLAPLRDPALVLDTIAQTLGARDGLAEHLGEREALLLLDNLEQVIEAAPELVSLVEACPNLRLLVTSRELLRVRGEVEYAVLPLAEPEAVELFSARARLDPDEMIAELCRRLDSLPLAVELAAARTSVLSPKQILERLTQRLDLLKGGRDADPRQQTLRTTIAWSYELLSPEEQQLFARLAVFPGGCRVEAAEGVADASLDVLQSLVEKSLVRHTGERFWMLETIREYAGERLQESGEADELRRRHGELHLALAEESRRALRGPHQRLWLDRLTSEDDNLRAALGWAIEGGHAEMALRLVWALEVFWIRAGRDDEAARWLGRALVLDRPGHPLLRARALATGGVFAARRGALELASERFDESIPALRALGDREGLSFALRGLAWLHEFRGEHADAVPPLEEAIGLFAALGHPISTRLCDLGEIALAKGDRERARISFERAVEAAREEGDLSGEAQALNSLGDLALQAGAVEKAEQLLRESLRVDISVRDPMVPETMFRLAGVAVRLGRPKEAARLIAAAERLVEDASSPHGELEEGIRSIENLLRERDSVAFERERAAVGAVAPDQLAGWLLADSLD
jgi:predicted ATPase